MKVAKRVPIWVFSIAVVASLSVIGWLNYSMIRTSDRTQKILSTHIENNNAILRSLSHGVAEIAVNQRRVMDKIELEFTEIPHYERQ